MFFGWFGRPEIMLPLVIVIGRHLEFLFFCKIICSINSLCGKYEGMQSESYQFIVTWSKAALGWIKMNPDRSVLYLFARGELCQDCDIRYYELFAFCTAAQLAKNSC
ncbi:unnamed protein product [Musa hybrid cultivar]